MLTLPDIDITSRTTTFDRGLTVAGKLNVAVCTPPLSHGSARHRDGSRSTLVLSERVEPSPDPTNATKGSSMDIAHQTSALYMRTHLIGASGGLQLARLVAHDPWTVNAIDHLPGELEQEMAFVRTRVEELSGHRESWLGAVVGVGTGVRGVAGVVGLTRGRFRRVAALEAMRSLLLAKKAMWELGMEGRVDFGPGTARCAELDQQAARQAEELQALHRRAAEEAFTRGG